MKNISIAAFREKPACPDSPENIHSSKMRQSNTENKIFQVDGKRSKPINKLTARASIMGGGVNICSQSFVTIHGIIHCKSMIKRNRVVTIRYSIACSASLLT